ncbi:MAG: hypothetical protein IPJ17_03275 [Holophagales bacterium]|nr:MAG: hypothetical protein IPJ17_03275 [Holophagales bacterium]
MRRSLSVLLVLSAQLGNVVRCQAAAPKRPSEAPALREEAGPVEILRLLYGNYDSARHAAIAEPGEPGEPAGPGRSADEATLPVIATVEGLYRYPPATPDHLLAIVAENPEGADSHGQSPGIAGALFEKVPGGWHLRARNPSITEMGSYGAAPEGTLVQLGPSRWGVRYEPGFTNMGESTVGLTLLAPVGESIVEVLALGELESENSGGCDEAEKNCYEFKSQVTFERGGNPDWFDVVVVTSGSRLNDEMTVETFRETHRYTFSGSVYQEAASAAARR